MESRNYGSLLAVNSSADFTAEVEAAKSPIICMISGSPLGAKAEITKEDQLIGRV